MKLSLTIAATLAAIAVIAASGPLHACALEQVNSFERDVDIYRRNNRKRHSESYNMMANNVDYAIHATFWATHHTQRAVDLGDPQEQEKWRGHNAHQKAKFEEMRQAQSYAAQHTHRTSLHSETQRVSNRAKAVALNADRVNLAAQQAVHDYKPQWARMTALKLEHAKTITHHAIQHTQLAIDHGPPHEQGMWRSQNEYHKKTHLRLQEMHDEYNHNARQRQTDLIDHSKVSAHADEVAAIAHQVIGVVQQRLPGQPKL